MKLKVKKKSKLRKQMKVGTKLWTSFFYKQRVDEFIILLMPQIESFPFSHDHCFLFALEIELFGANCFLLNFINFCTRIIYFLALIYEEV